MPAYLHSDNPGIGVAVTGGNHYWLTVAWALAPGLLDEPPLIARTPANYQAGVPQWVGAAPTIAAPVYLWADPAWWRQAREQARTVWSRVFWRSRLSDPWSVSATVEFVVGHAPQAVLVPDMVVDLDAAGAVPVEVVLDGSASGDPDRAAPVNPAGPLSYRWTATVTPPTMTAAGPLAAAIGALGASPVETLLAAGTVVPAADRGVYTFRLAVDDQERATVGAKAGQSRTAIADTRLLLGVPASGGVRLLAPTADRPLHANFEEGVDVGVAYRVDPALTALPAYAAGWRLRLRVVQAIGSPVAPSSPVGTVVHEIHEVPVPGRQEFLHWDGTAPALGGRPCVGAFDLELELLDAAGAATGVAGARTRQGQALVLDRVAWLPPVDAGASQLARSGAFMESGHAGFAGTALHGGLDIVRRPPGQPDLLAARSGTWAGGGTVTLVHGGGERTRYLHGDVVAAYAPGDLVVQGARLARMSNQGTVAVHLHFEHHTGAGAAAENPQAIVSLWDPYRPEVEAVYLRRASAAGVEARFTNPATGIAGAADLIVRCRDRGHPGYLSTVQSVPYQVRVTEQPGTGMPWPQLSFDTLTAGDHVREFYEAGSHPNFSGTAADLLNYYLLYLRRDTTVYRLDAGPLTLEVTATDRTGAASAPRRVVVGPAIALATPPPRPATTAAMPQPFTLEIEVRNALDRLNADPANNTAMTATDDFAIGLTGQPPGWTVAPLRTGAIPAGAVRRVLLTIDPHGTAPTGMVFFDVVVASGILSNVGDTLPLSVEVS